MALYAVVGVIAVVVVAFFGVTRTNIGRSSLVGLIENAASSPDMTIRIGALEGAVPFDTTVRDVSIADGRGEWLRLDRARVVWRPLSLLRGVVDIGLAEADTVTVVRAPESNAETPVAETTSGGILPELPVGIALDRLSVGEIALGEELFGQPASLAVKGSARLVSAREGLHVDLDLSRIDDVAGQIVARLGFVPGEDRLSVDVRATEPAGGIVSRMAGIEDLPPLSFTAKGEGPLDHWSGDLVLDLAGKAGAQGQIAVQRAGAERVLTAKLAADIAALLPADIAPLASGQSAFAAEARFGDDGSIVLSRSELSAAAAHATADGRYEAGTKTVKGNLNVVAGTPLLFAQLVPVSLSWTDATLRVMADGTLDALRIKAETAMSDLAVEGYGAGQVALTADVLSQGPVTDPATRFGVAVDGRLAGISAPDAALSKTIGESATLALRGSLASDLVATVDSARVELAPLAATYTGMVNPGELTGTLRVERADLTALRAFAGDDLAGNATLAAEVDMAFDLSRLKLALNGLVDNLRTGIAQADQLSGGKIALSGGVSRAEDGGFGFEKFKVEAAHASLTADGSATPERANVVAKLALPDLAKLDSRVSGRGAADVSLAGSLEALDGVATITVDEAKAMGRPVQALKLEVKASDLLGAPSANLALSGAVDGKPARGTGRVARSAEGATRVEGLDLTLGSATLKGDIALDPAQLATGKITFNAGNLRDLGPLLLTELAGAVALQADLAAANGGQDARLNGTIDKFAGFGVSLANARIEANARDVTRAPVLDARADIRDMVASGVSVARANLTAKGSGQTTDITLNGVAQGSDVQAAARITAGDTTVIDIQQARLSRGGQRLDISPNARVELAGGGVRISGLDIRSGNGSIRVSGQAGDKLDIQAAIRSFPLAIAELAAPGLGLSGTLSGEANVSGSPSRPAGRYQLSVAGLTMPAISDSGLQPIAIQANGTMGQGRVGVDATIRSGQAVTLRVNGSAPAGEGPLDLAVTGPVDLGLANGVLSASGQTVAGRAAVDLRLRGTTAAPSVGGNVRITGGRFQDPVNGLLFDNIQAVISGNDRELVLSSLSARARNGGIVSGEGRVTLDTAAGFPGSIAIKTRRSQLVSSELLNTVTDLDLTISGPLARSPRLAGVVDIKSLEINIPNRFPLSLSPIDVKHVNAPKAVRERLRKEEALQRQAAASPPFVMALDLTINAPGRVFVRGQGINAELGGTVRIGGNSAAPSVDGGFNMRRGTLSILGRTLNFTRGEVGFAGRNLDPDLDFLAEAPASDVTAQVRVTGAANNPQISFSSQPELPRDEVLARLLFGRPATSLTTSQTIQLAQAVAQLTGVGGGDALGELGRSLGLDSVSVGADDNGNVGVGVGKRINDNIYLGVEQGTTSNSSRVKVDVNITDHIKVQGEAGADGSSAVGVGMEWDY